MSVMAETSQSAMGPYVSRRCFETTGKWLEEWID